MHAASRATHVSPFVGQVASNQAAALDRDPRVHGTMQAGVGAGVHAFTHLVGFRVGDLRWRG